MVMNFRKRQGEAKPKPHKKESMLFISNKLFKNQGYIYPLPTPSLQGTTQR
jgi:hypothetical protein